MSGKVVTIFEKVANSGWQINQEHLSHIFQSVGQNHVSIFSINGSSRTGKSFTLNYFLKYLLHGVKQDWIHAQLPDYFVSDSGGARVTTGIKMWSEPLYLPLPNAERIAIILLDTQGLFDDVTSSEDNTAIYAFSSLLSSLMIYNVMSNMDERHWQFLESFLAYANLSLQDGQDKNQTLPTAMHLLIRDWYHFKDYDYGLHDTCSPPQDGNLNHKYFQILNTLTQDIAKTRKAIASSFTSVSTTILPYPGNAIATENEAKLDACDPDFVAHFKAFVTHILSPEVVAANRVRIGDVFISGEEMIAISEKWGNLFKSNSIPQPQSIFAATVKLQFEKIMGNLRISFQQKIDQQFVSAVDDTNFKTLSAKFRAEYVTNFVAFKTKLGLEDAGNEYTTLFESELDSVIAKAKTLNQKKVDEIMLQEERERVRLEIEAKKKVFERKLLEDKAKREADAAELFRKQEQYRREQEQIRINAEQAAICRQAEEDIRTGQQMTARYHAQGKHNLTVKVARVNGQVQFDYWISGGVVDFSELIPPVRNLTFG